MAVEITEVRIKLMDDPQERLQAFCSITFDTCFVIRDLKIIEGAKGSFVAMPSRKLTDRCPQCHSKNHLRSLYCNQCGARLQEDRAAKDGEGRAKLYADIAHPINSRCREMIQAQVLRAFDEELVKSQLPGYVCTYDDYGEDAYAMLSEEAIVPMPSRQIAAGPRETTLRIDDPEPAAPPHHSSVSSRRHITENSPQYSARADFEEGFGAGILEAS
jgi:stage V sporulation protein G